MGGVFHISEEEAARDFGALLARVRAGEEAVVEGAGRPVVMRNCDSTDAVRRVRGKSASEILAAFAAWEAVHGPITIDPGFADDVAEAHERLNQPLDGSKWD